MTGAAAEGFTTAFCPTRSVGSPGARAVDPGFAPWALDGRASLRSGLEQGACRAGSCGKIPLDSEKVGFHYLHGGSADEEIG